MSLGGEWLREVEVVESIVKSGVFVGEWVWVGMEVFDFWMGM